MTYPTQCYLELTRRCNLRCIHCFAEGSLQDAPEMTLAQVKDIYRQILDLGIIYVNISGGEPLLHRDFFPIIAYAAEQPYDTCLLTNGTLWDREAFQKLDRADPNRRIHIQISLDGPFEIMSKQRLMTREQYDRTLQAMQEFRTMGFFIGCLHVVSALTVSHSLETIHRALFEFKADAVQVVPVFPAGRAASARNLFDFWDAWAKFVVETTDIKKEERWGNLSHAFNIGFFTLYELVEPLDRAGRHSDIALVWGLDIDDPAEFLKCTRRGVYCESGQSELAIASDLELYPCVASLRTPFKAGNLLEKSLIDLWHDSEMLGWFRHNLRRVLEYEPCASCEYGPICGGGCRIAALELTGDRYRPDPRCPRVLKSITRDAVK